MKAMRKSTAIAGILTCWICAFSHAGEPFAQQARFVAEGTKIYDYFGVSSAVDGDVLVITSWEFVEGEDGYGAAYVYEKPAGHWSDDMAPVARLETSPPRAGVGAAVAIDGDVIVLGAPTDPLTGSNHGSAYVYVKPPGGWSGTLTPSATLKSSDESAYLLLGSSVDIAGDTIVVGAPGYSNTNARAALVFQRPADGWSGTVNESALLVPSDPPADTSGFAGAVAIDGETIVVGADGRTLGDLPGVGGAYVYRASSPGDWAGTLTESALLLPTATFSSLPTIEQGRFGLDVAIDGNVIAVGAPRENQDRGKLYVYSEPPLGWGTSSAEVAEIVLSATYDSDALGLSIELDGRYLAASSSGSPVGASEPGVGMIYLFRRPDGGWVNTFTPEAQLAPAPQDQQRSAEFGQIGFGLDAGTLVVGAPGVDPGLSTGGPNHGDGQGIAYVFETCGNLASSKSLSVNAWTLVGLPCDPEAPGTVESVFGDDLDPARYATRWVMYAYDPVLDDYVMLGLDDALVPGAGYWILSLDAAALDVEGDYAQVVQSAECVTPAGCFEIELLGPEGIVDIPEFQLIGMPFPGESIPWRDVRIVEPDGTTYTPSSAQSWDIMSRTFFKYDGSDYVAYDDKTVGMEGVLDPFDGVWISSLMSTIPGATFPAGTKILIPTEPLSKPPSP